MDFDGFESPVNIEIQKTLAVKRAHFCSRGGRILKVVLVVVHHLGFKVNFREVVYDVYRLGADVDDA